MSISQLPCALANVSLAIVLFLGAGCADKSLPEARSLPEATGLPDATGLTEVGALTDARGSQDFRLDIPECESSALLAANCPKDHPNCLWMADNERKDALFLFSAAISGDEKPTTIHLVNPDKTPVEIGDIEALAALPNGQVLAVGSHSLKSSCEISKKRHSFGVISPNSGLTTLLTWSNKLFDCAAAFPTQRPADADTFCDAVSVGNKEAKNRLDNPTVAAACADLESFNVEGAVADRNGRIWLGLRAPLLNRTQQTSDARDAVLLRMNASVDPMLPAPEFDDLIKLDLDGFGVRELSATKDALMIVAGPALDKSVPFRLYRLSWPEFESGEKLLKPRKVMDLATSSEGFALVGKYAFTAIDGDDKNKVLCPQHKHVSKFLLPQ